MQLQAIEERTMRSNVTNRNNHGICDTAPSNQAEMEKSQGSASSVPWCFNEHTSAIGCSHLPRSLNGTQVQACASQPVS